MEQTITQQIEEILTYVGEHYQGGMGEASINEALDEILSLCQENIYRCPSCHEWGIYLERYEPVSGGGMMLVNECVRCRNKRDRSAPALNHRQVESFCRATVSEVCQGGMTRNEIH